MMDFILDFIQCNRYMRKMWMKIGDLAYFLNWEWLKSFVYDTVLYPGDMGFVLELED